MTGQSIIQHTKSDTNLDIHILFLQFDRQTDCRMVDIPDSLLHWYSPCIHTGRSVDYLDCPGKAGECIRQHDCYSCKGLRPQCYVSCNGAENGQLKDGIVFMHSLGLINLSSEENDYKEHDICMNTSHMVYQNNRSNWFITRKKVLTFTKYLIKPTYIDIR